MLSLSRNFGKHCYVLNCTVNSGSLIEHGSLKLPSLCSERWKWCGSSFPQKKKIQNACFCWQKKNLSVQSIKEISSFGLRKEKGVSCHLPKDTFLEYFYFKTIVCSVAICRTHHASIQTKPWYCQIANEFKTSVLLSSQTSVLKDWASKA